MATNQPENPVPEVIAAEMAKDRELRREERQQLTAMPAADLATAAQRTAFMPASMGEAMQFASLMARSNFVPMHLRGKDGDCMAIILQAARWGMDPFAVANKSYFAKDGAPPAYEAQLVNAVVNSSGALLGRLRVQFDGEGERLRCTVRGFLRADPADEKVKTQHISRITTRNSPLWKADPEQQLLYYTTRAWARAWCPEVLLGVYTPDELDSENVAPAPVQNLDAPPRPQRSDYAEFEAVGGGAHSDDRPPDGEAQQKVDQAQQAEKLPETPEEWETWAKGVEDALAARGSVDDVNALRRRQQPRIDSAPAEIGERINSAFFDRIASIMGGSQAEQG